MRGLRIHLAGSASVTCADDLLEAAHDLVTALVRRVVPKGGGLVVGVGGEPTSEGGRPCIFDWTILSTIAVFSDPAPGWPEERRARFVVVASQRALELVPEAHGDLWTHCRSRNDLSLETTPAGWRMGGIIRQLQVFRGDILVALGGGAGTEHLAQLYRAEGKPVVPIYADLGAVTDDGNGGSRYLHELALADTAAFFKLRDGRGDATARLSLLRLAPTCDPAALADSVVALLEDLTPPRAFYVRLTAKHHPDFDDVDQFFREVVDPSIAERGFQRHEVGFDRPESAFINIEVFGVLHRAALVVVDVTGLRPNCMVELGYALGRQRRVILCAREGTALPFDTDKLPTFFWSLADDEDVHRQSFNEWVDRYIDLPPIVA